MLRVRQNERKKAFGRSPLYIRGKDVGLLSWYRGLNEIIIWAYFSSLLHPKEEKLGYFFSQGHVLGPQKPMFY